MHLDNNVQPCLTCFRVQRFERVGFEHCRDKENRAAAGATLAICLTIASGTRIFALASRSRFASISFAKMCVLSRAFKKPRNSSVWHEARRYAPGSVHYQWHHVQNPERSDGLRAVTL